MRVGSKSYYTNVVSVPAGSSGEWKVRRVRRPAGYEFKLATLRTHFLGGDAMGSMTFQKATTWHELAEGDSVWMTDLPIEQVQIDRATEGLSGDVLVGGLGLGYAVTILARQPEVRRVAVVELSEDVIDLVWPHTLKGKAARSKVELVHGDLFKYIKRTGDSFDGAFYDIWAGDGESTFWDVVVPLLDMSVGKVRTRPRCWNENVMRAQLRFGLFSHLSIAAQRKGHLDQLCEPTGDELRAKWFNWRVPFFEWYRRERPSMAAAMAEAAAFADRVGVPVAYQGNVGMATTSQAVAELA